MNYETRRDVRIDKNDLNSFYFFSSYNTDSDDTNHRISLTIESAIKQLMNIELDIKIEGLKTLNQMIRSFQKFLIPKITIEIVNEICLLANIEKYSCISLQFLTILIQFCPSFYNLFSTSGFYQNLIQKIQPSVNISFYKQILLFLCATIKRVPESILMMIKYDLLNNIRNMDQTQFIDQLQIIYSSSFIQFPDLSILDSIFLYLTFPKSRLILETLKCIKNCISNKQILEKIWPNICFDNRLISLLSNENFDVVSTTISIFSIIFTFSESSINQFFENKELVDLIFSYTFHDDINIKIFVFDFLISLVNSANEASNINNIFELVRNLKIKKETLENLNFCCQQKVTHIILGLYLKLSSPQVEMINDENLLKKMIQISQENEEDAEICIQTLHLLMTKFISNTKLYQFFSKLLDESDIDDEILEKLKD